MIFVYAIVALLTSILFCNTLATEKNWHGKRVITPLGALFLGLIWPIGLLAAYIAFIRGR